MPERVAFVKALAVYEDTVGGLGSTTGLKQVFPLVPDGDYAVMDWILATTRSYDWYSSERSSAERRAWNEEREAESVRVSKRRKSEKASTLLFPAVRRGDTKAVESLLRRGADPR